MNEVELLKSAPVYVVLFLVSLHFIINLLKMVFDFVKGKEPKDAKDQPYVYDKLGEHFLMLKEISTDVKELQKKVDAIETDLHEHMTAFNKHMQSDTDFFNNLMARLNNVQASKHR